MRQTARLTASLLASLSILLPCATEAAAQDAPIESTDSARLRVRSVTEILDTLEILGTPDYYPKPVNKLAGPWVLFSYRHLKPRKFTVPELPLAFPNMEVMTSDSTREKLRNPYYEIMDIMDFSEEEDSLTNDSTEDIDRGPYWLFEPEKEVDILSDDPRPAWLRNALRSYRMQEDIMYRMMVEDPDRNLEYTYWTLPVPPKLKEDDFSFIGFMERLNLPEVDAAKAVLPEEELQQIHWLHNIGAALHFSQAFVSKNWYQGGNNHLSLLINLNWNVQLNQVYHPKLLFQSALSYKLGLNSTPQDEVHTYSISEDLLQYNLNAGWKAFKKWFYSFNLLFKTQILSNYEKNSMKRTASFLSPGDFNLGLGMAYTHQNEKKTFQFTATISPLSYNLKTCISDKVDHGQFNIPAHRKSRSEIGSNGEFNMNWQITPDINYKSRVFLFTDYKYSLYDWENTFNFNINKFLSTQIYVHLRYDSSSEKDKDWKRLMMREVLSFGLTYTWSTK